MTLPPGALAVSLSIAGWAGLALLSLPAQLPAVCGEVPLWVLVQWSGDVFDGRMLVAIVTWALWMLLAMMAASLWRPFAHIRFQSLPRRTSLLLLLYIFGYVSVWLPVTAALVVIAAALTLAVEAGPGLTAGAALCAFGWACTPVHQTALNRCHLMPPLASLGKSAMLDAVAVGLRHGTWCVASCWLLMLLPLLSPQGGIALMAVSALTLTLLRLLPPRRARWQAFGFLLSWKALVVCLQWLGRRCRHHF